METLSSGASNSQCPGERASVKGIRVPSLPRPGRRALEGHEIPGFALQRPPRGQPRASGDCPGVKVGGGRCFPPPSRSAAGAVLAAPGGRVSRSFLPVRPGGWSPPFPDPRVRGI